MKKSQETERELEKVLGGIGKKAESHFPLPILCNLAKPVKSYLGLTFLLHRSALRGETENYEPIVVLGFIDDVFLIKRALIRHLQHFSQESTGSTPNSRIN